MDPILHNKQYFKLIFARTSFWYERQKKFGWVCYVAVKNSLDVLPQESSGLAVKP